MLCDDAPECSTDFLSRQQPNTPSSPCQLKILQSTNGQLKGRTADGVFNLSKGFDSLAYFAHSKQACQACDVTTNQQEQRRKRVLCLSLPMTPSAPVLRTCEMASVASCAAAPPLRYPRPPQLPPPDNLPPSSQSQDKLSQVELSEVKLSEVRLR